MTPKNLQIQLGLTVEAFARYAEVSKPTVNRWKYRDSEPKKWQRDRIRILDNLEKEIMKIRQELDKNENTATS